MATKFDLAKKTEMYQFFSIAFNAAPGVTYMNQLQEAVVSGMSTKQIVNVFSLKPQFTSVYPTFTSDDAFAAKLIENVVGASATAAAKTEAIKDTVAALASGYTRGDVVWQIFTNLAAKTGDAMWGGTATMMANKVAVAAYYTETLATDTTDLAVLRGVLAGVTATTDVSTTTALAATQPAVTSVANTNLTVGQDTLFGTSIADTFKAMVAQNMYGSQTNQLASGDQINGGAGVDTLLATVQMASPLGGTATQAITPTTTSVEKAYFTALTTDNSNANLNVQNVNEAVVINAKYMTGLTNVGSVQSDASLTIQNLTTLTDTGVYADRRNTESVTIRMDHTGNDKALDQASNLTVLFDNDYLVAGKTSLSTIGYWVEDREAAKATPATPLKKIDATGVVFTINGSTAIEVKIPADALKAFLATDGTWAGYTALLQTALTVLKTGTPAVGTTAAVAADARLANLNFSLDTTNMRILGKDGTTLPVPAPAITLTSTVGDKLVAGGFVTSSEFGITYDVFTEITNATSVSTNLPVTSNIELLKAGRGAEGGNLTVGAMSTDLNNTFNWATTSALKQGVEVFNISVEGDATQFSSLASLQSTNNTLKVVNVVNKAGSAADLIIGNHNSVAIASALKDVQTFNAAGFANNLTLNATVTTESIAKYLNLKDGAPALPTADNVAFVYTSGAGKDKLTVTLDSAVVGATSTLTGQSDFTFAIDGGAGNDTITTNIGGNQTTQWYVDQKLNKNITVTGGAGDDTINTKGSGDIKILAGDGVDTVYADNTGAVNTAWVVSAANTSVANLQAEVSNNTGNHFLYKGTLTVSYSAPSGAGTVTQGAAAALSNGWESKVDVATGANYTVSQFHINQAIKLAINGDTVMSKVLVATDGPGNTLVIKSLIDGTFVNTDLLIAVAATPVNDASYSATEQAAVVTAYNAYMNAVAGTYTIAAVQAIEAASVTAANAVTGMSTPVLGVLGTLLATPTVTTQGTVGGNEVVSVVFSGTAAAGTFLTFDGVTTDVSGLTSALVATAINGATHANWTSSVTASTITFTAAATGDVADLTSADFATVSNGTFSAAATDNSINLGAGNDVAVFSTSLKSNETLVYTGYDQGKDTIVNFVAGAATDIAGGDKIDFTSYLTGTNVAVGVTARIATSYVATAATGANEVHVLSMTSTTTDTFAGLTGAKLLSAVNTTGNVAFAGLTDASLTAANNVTAANLVGGIGHAVVMVQNDKNLGEYAVYDLTFNGAATTGTDFTAATLIGTVDFGAALTAANVVFA